MSSPITLLVLSALPSAHAADYTGDGIDDLLIGMPYEGDISGVVLPGALDLLRGSTTGLRAAGNAFIHQDTAGVTGSNSGAEYFGFGLGAGDIDGDGTDDIIVGGMNETVGGAGCGAVWRLEIRASRGGANYVTTSQSYSQDTAGVSGSAEAADHFGWTVAVADFDGDGYDDVVVGIPDEDVGAIFDGGGIEYLRGSATGLTTTGQLYYDQNSAGVTGGVETSDHFGFALAAGDFDDDGYADLAIGIPGEDYGGTDEGSVQVMYGSSIGPGVTSPNDELWSAGEDSAAGTSDDGNECGTALAVGDFDGDGYDDLAIGCSGYDSSGDVESGAVLIVYGSASGLDDSELWGQDSSGVIGTPEASDHFGDELTAGDFDGDGYDDLAIAATDESYGAFIENGVVHVLFGSSGGITDLDNLLLFQDTGSTVGGTPEDDEHWGRALTSGDYNADGRDDLAVGSPYDTVSTVSNAGAVNVFYGSASGPSTTGDQWWTEDSTDIGFVAEGYDRFGYSLR